MTLPKNHPFRIELNNEVHARPPEALRAPCRISFLALSSDVTKREAAWKHVYVLAQKFNAPLPQAGANHYSADFGAFRVKWERHTEFVRYKFILQGLEAEPFADPAIKAVPEDWLANLPGEVLVATHVILAPADPDRPDYEAISQNYFEGNVLVGSTIAGGAGRAFTDFRIHKDGFGRILAQDIGMTERQAGRMIQRLLEIDAYRMLALLALPVARNLAPFLDEGERELAKVAADMVEADGEQEAALLNRLTKLEAAIEYRQSENQYRFSAASAYYELVQRRIAELREDRIQGLQQFLEFMERRLAPAMQTCATMESRQNALSLRVSRATQLLSTKVDIVREQQNQALLTSMNQRAKVQLRLQQTVEGLSIAAVSYYIVGLMGYAAKAVSAGGVNVSPEIVTGISIPFVVLAVALAVRRVKKIVAPEEA